MGASTTKGRMMGKIPNPTHTVLKTLMGERNFKIFMSPHIEERNLTFGKYYFRVLITARSAARALILYPPPLRQIFSPRIGQASLEHLLLSIYADKTSLDRVVQAPGCPQKSWRGIPGRKKAIPKPAKGRVR